MIDGGVASHPSFRGASIEQNGFAGPAKATGHGTAVASLLVGRQAAFHGAAQGARLYVGPDTSVTHLAAASGCPTIALFGPTDPRLWGPWPEHGLAFNRRSLNACLIAHHDRGYPYLCDFNGGEVDVRVVMAAKTRIIRENQNGGHEACRGCPHLVVRRWRQPRYPVRLMGIAQFSHCNIECNYCYLQTKDPSEFSAGFDPVTTLMRTRPGNRFAAVAVIFAKSAG